AGAGALKQLAPRGGGALFYPVQQPLPNAGGVAHRCTTAPGGRFFGGLGLEGPPRPLGKGEETLSGPRPAARSCTPSLPEGQPGGGTARRLGRRFTSRKCERAPGPASCMARPLACLVWPVP